MKKISFILLGLCLIISLFSGCNGGNGSDKPLVVVSILPLAEFTEQIGGDLITVSTMVPQGADPHTFDPAPSQMIQLADASMYVKVGAGLEFELAYMDKIEAMNKDMLIVDSSKGIDLLEASEHHHHDGDDDDETGIVVFVCGLPMHGQPPKQVDMDGFTHPVCFWYFTTSA